MPVLKSNMTLTKFRASTKLDLSVNLEKQDKFKMPGAFG